MQFGKIMFNATSTVSRAAWRGVRGTARFALAAFVVAGFCALPGDRHTAQAAVAVHTAPKPSSPGMRSGPTVHAAKNPHLHVPSNVKTPPKKGLSSKPAPVKGVKPAPKTVTHLRAVQRVYLHHTTGIITGTVNGSTGHTIAGARVHLAKPRGHELRNHRARHVVYTNASGVYTMRGVRAGSYRVVAAKKNVGSGHAGVTIAKATHHVHVRLAAASSGGKKRHR